MPTKKENLSSDNYGSVNQPKRLYRSEKDQMIGGVCGGLGDYFNIDSSIFRILFIIFVLAGGSGVLPYFILWIVLPLESSVKGISEETIKANAEEIKAKAEEFTSKKGDESSKTWLGIIFLVIGLVILLDNFGVFSTFRRIFNFNIWELWPLVLVFIGFKILQKK